MRIYSSLLSVFFDKVAMLSVSAFVLKATIIVLILVFVGVDAAPVSKAHQGYAHVSFYSLIGFEINKAIYFSII